VKDRKKRHPAGKEWRSIAWRGEGGAGGVGSWALGDISRVVGSGKA
jgi:hypothetical protein